MRWSECCVGVMAFSAVLRAVSVSVEKANGVRWYRHILKRP